MKLEALGFQYRIWFLREMLVEGFARVGALSKNGGYFYDKGSGMKIGKR
jgi:hypothetical protein